MDGASQQPEELILRSSRVRSGFWFLVTLGMTILYGYYVGDCLLMWLFAIGSAVVAVLFLDQLIFRRSHLRLTPRGFYQHGRLHSTFFAWNEVRDFRVGSKPWIVAFDFTNSEPSVTTVRKIARFTTGSDGALAECYGLSAAELAKLMNQWRARAVARDNAAVPAVSSPTATEPPPIDPEPADRPTP
jgi:hypothetical protein